MLRKFYNHVSIIEKTETLRAVLSSHFRACPHKNSVKNHSETFSCIVCSSVLKKRLVPKLFIDHHKLNCIFWGRLTTNAPIVLFNFHFSVYLSILFFVNWVKPCARLQYPIYSARHQSNPHGFPPEPKSGASDGFTIPAFYYAAGQIGIYLRVVI